MDKISYSLPPQQLSKDHCLSMDSKVVLIKQGIQKAEVYLIHNRAHLMNNLATLAQISRWVVAKIERA